jgi:hypothetical protein
MFMKGVHARALPMTQPSFVESDGWFRQAIAEDTGLTFQQADDAGIGYPRAWAWMAYGMALTAQEPWQVGGTIARAVELANRAVLLDINDYDTHWVAAFVHLVNGNSEQARVHRKEALYLVGEDRNLHLLNEMADVLVWQGKPQRAFELLEKTRRTTDWNRWSMAWSLYFLARDVPSLYESALFEAELTFWKPGDPHYEIDIQLLIAAITMRQADWLDANNQPIWADQKRQKSQAALTLFMEQKPGWTLLDEMIRMPFAATTAGQSLRNHWSDTMIKLGFT